MYSVKNKKNKEERHLDEWHEHPAHGGDLGEGVVVDRLPGDGEILPARQRELILCNRKEQLRQFCPNGGHICRRRMNTEERA